MAWRKYHEGKTLGTRGSEGGHILLDEEHPDGARLTVEQTGRAVPFSITCGIYGWFVHTCFLATHDAVEKALEKMKLSLEGILAIVPRHDENPSNGELNRVDDAIAEFIARFP